MKNWGYNAATNNHIMPQVILICYMIDHMVVIYMDRRMAVDMVVAFAFAFTNPKL